MKWCCFLFWFVYRFILACLAHFNWFLALYTNCIYFTLWKSYDLLWFWMHLTLCTCFQSLRRENYMVVWGNLIWRRYTKYPDLTYKQLYFALYSGKGTKAERALQRLDTMEIKEREQRRLRSEAESSSSEDGENGDEVDGRDTSSTMCGPRVAVSDVISEEEAECRKYVYVGQAVDSQADFESMRSRRGESESTELTDTAPVRPARPSKESPSNGNVVSNSGGSQHNTSSNNNTTVVADRMIFKDTIPIRPPPKRSDSEESKKTTWERIVEKLPIPHKAKNNGNKDSSNEGALDILYPNYTNTYDVYDEQKLAKRMKRDRKALTQRVRRRIREELREVARQERKRKKMADAIELLLQLLRMMTSFAVLVGNIRKTFIPAQFKYLRPGQHAYDRYELLLLFRVTTFLDVSMFWTNVMWVYCLQWHLCCRLGFMRFWIWLAILSTMAVCDVVGLDRNGRDDHSDECRHERDGLKLVPLPAELNTRKVSTEMVMMARSFSCK